jgi:hypothetical protein
VFILSRFRALSIYVAALIVLGMANATGQLTTEFDVPYQLKLQPDGELLEMSGSFSWALPQNLMAVLATAPNLQVVRLESPGGHLLPALQVAMIIQQRGLNTYVGRFCASACTIAFLGGKERWLSPGARLGFHQARAPGAPAETANDYLRRAYSEIKLPPGFVEHVLRTPAQDLWYPTRAELRAIHYTTGDAPAAILSRDHGWPIRLTDLTRTVASANDDTLLQFAAAILELLPKIQATNAEACWAFAHEGPDTTAAALPPPILDAIEAIQQRFANIAVDPRRAASDAEQNRRTIAELIASIRAQDAVASMQGFRHGANHSAFCPSLHDLLQFALRLPEPRRAGSIRAVFWSSQN